METKDFFFEQVRRIEPKPLTHEQIRNRIAFMELFLDRHPPRYAEERQAIWAEIKTLKLVLGERDANGPNWYHRTEAESVIDVTVATRRLDPELWFDLQENEIIWNE